ncbi:MAG: uracil-DNA glycosylase [Candidatus Abyssobacteria bacterium SURF_5]|uniref:Type-4 uracil-DNA glycosylase n=1 Tax=Abyssobacteria bacterium (strain SURF_5) TaxID=2093360 RepID=A0A3A4NZF4_ABYX5|nr:MAG: uracil-DNA glycosylase [Candidatus Abyssubacteria bacterium SURF_5]
MNPSLQQRLEQLEEVHARVRVCRLCYLWKTRQNAVPGEGPLDPKVMFIGEGPGKKEDATGRPFIGYSGQFLNEALERIGLRRDDVFITSSVKCLPVNGRKPKPVSIEACNPYLQSQLQLVRPRLICLLGGVAAETVLGEKSISGIRGKMIERDQYRILATFHPAAARRFKKRRDDFLKDFELLARQV